jgi:hypothetical protein
LDKGHYNLADLSQKHFWTLVSGPPFSERLLTGQLLSIWMASFLSAFDTTVGKLAPLGWALMLVATLLGSISSDFEEANKASWLGTS